jgi:hypothetical protein
MKKNDRIDFLKFDINSSNAKIKKKKKKQTNKQTKKPPLNQEVLFTSLKKKKSKILQFFPNKRLF